MTRLLTKADPFHFHKSVGLACLFHFAYRFYCLCNFGVAFPVSESGWVTLLSCSLHLLLHMTSFVFHLPKKRNFNKPMLWPEFRVHNAVFGSRNTIGALLCLFLWTDDFVLQHPLLTWVSKAALLVGSMAAADQATRHAGDRNQRTTNAMPFPDWTTCSEKKEVQLFYTQAQFHATMLAVSHPGLSFASVFGIEIASLCMTLVRKAKISTSNYHQVYALSLWLVYPMLFVTFIHGRFPTVVLLGPLSSITKMLRVRKNVNKYVLWTCFVSASIYIDLYLRVYVNAVLNVVAGLGVLQMFVPVVVNWMHIRCLFRNPRSRQTQTPCSLPQRVQSRTRTHVSRKN